MGVSKFLLSGDEDEKLFENVVSVNERFGHGLDCRYEKSPLKYLRNIVNNEVNRPTVVHLTMYGEPFKSTTPSIPKGNGVIVIVGGAKVPGEIFKISDYNIAVGNQPHSEVAALAVALSQWHSSVAIQSRFEGGSIRVIPSREGKNVVDKKSTSES